MNTYPTLLTAYGSDPRPLKSIEIDRAEDGTARGRITSADKVKIPLKHIQVTPAQKITLDAFYAANRQAPFEYTSPADNVLRTCLFASGAPVWEIQPGNLYEVRVDLEQV